MIKGLESQMADSLSGKIEDRLADAKDISVAEARDAIKSSSFSDYMKLREDSTQGTQGTTGTSGEQAQSYHDGNGKISDFNVLNQGDVVNATVNGAPVPGKVLNKVGNDVEVELADGNTMTVSGQDLSGPDAEQIKAIDAAKATGIGAATDQEVDSATVQAVNTPTKAQSFLSNLAKTASSAKSGFNKGLNDDVNKDAEEINRIRELAGIAETCTAGATGAGAIASGPSIVGDTSNSSKPTKRLTTQNRLKKEEKDRLKAKAKKEAATQKRADT